jgi:hypothetical protein
LPTMKGKDRHAGLVGPISSIQYINRKPREAMVAAEGERMIRTSCSLNQL